MALTTDEGFLRILRPFRIMSPFSITMAATNRYDKSAMYLAYAILSLVPPTVIAWYDMLAPENHKYILFNTNGVAFTHWALIFVLNGYLIITLRKHRMQKLIFEMQKLDKLISLSNEAGVKKMVVHNVVWLVWIIVFHVSSAVHGYSLNDSCQIRVLVLFVIVDVAMMSEVACFSCFTILVHAGLKHFVLHLNLLLAGKLRDKEMDVTLCYRQTHRVLGSLVKACQLQMAAVICFSFYSCLRIFLIFIQTSCTIENICLNVVTLSRYMGVLVVMGALGQAVASRLTQVRRLALLMEYSPHGEVQSAGRCISAEAAVRPRGLSAWGGRLAGRLPLHVGAALAAAVILLLQLGVNTLPSTDTELKP